MSRQHTRFLVLAVIIVGISTFFIFDLKQYLSLFYIQNQYQNFQIFYDKHQMMTWVGYALFYIFITALSLPGAAVMTLIGGAVFGLWFGVFIVSFASTLGATLAMLASRFVVGRAIQDKYSQKLQTINTGINKDGGFYLFTLRLIPVVPFFLINLLMGLTKFPAFKFFWVSQLGMLPGTFAYVFAGTQIAQIETLSDIVSPSLMLAFIILGLLPLVLQKMIGLVKSARIYKGHIKPKSFDYNVVVIGGGAAGLVSSYIVAALKGKVALVEKNKMGGDCLNTGCVPSKALIRSAKIFSYLKNHTKYGLVDVEGQADFQKIMQRVHETIAKVEPHDSVERYTNLGVECLQGSAEIVDPWTVNVGGKKITARSIILATGAEPFVPNIEGLSQIPFYTSDTIWGLTKLPRKLLILGGGPIGCEMAQAFQRLGSQVTLVDRNDKIMKREDDDVSGVVQAAFEKEGVKILTSHGASKFVIKNKKQFLICDDQEKQVAVEFDAVLMALGRKARVSDFGLDLLGVELSPQGTIEGDVFLRTNFPNIYVCGDAIGPYQFTHVAAHQAWYASINALFSPFKKFKVDYRVIPWCTFTDPEVAHVGLNEKQAKAKGIAYEVTQYGLDDLDRAIADGVDLGFIKVLTVPGKDKILGATIVGAHAGDLLAEFVLAMKWNLGLNKILGTIHIYPTMAEANKYAAGNWKKAHAPQWALRLLEKWHRWRRG